MNSVQKATTMVQSILRSLTNEGRNEFMDAITEYYLQLDTAPRMIITELKSTVKVEPVAEKPAKVEPVTTKLATAKPAAAEPPKAEGYKKAVLSTKTVEAKIAEPFLWSDSAEESNTDVIIDRIQAATALFGEQTPLPPIKNSPKGKVNRTCKLHPITDLHTKIFPKTRTDGFSEFLSELTKTEFHALFEKDCDSSAFQDELTRLVPLFFTKNVEGKNVKCMNFFTYNAGVTILRGDYDSSKMELPNLRTVFKIPAGSEPPASLLREIAFAQAVQTEIVNQMIPLLENVQKTYGFTLVKHTTAPYTPFSLSFKNRETAYSFAGVISKEEGRYVH